MKIGIIGAMDEEVAILVDQLTDRTTWEEAGAKFYSGNIGTTQVVVTKSGIGKTLAAITTTILISRYQVDVIINTGSAGGIGTGLEVGDIVISDQVAYSDVDVTAFGYEFGQIPQMPLYYDADKKLVEVAKKASKNTQLDAKIGLIVSADTFVHSKEQIDAIKGHFPNCMANEMEGAAIAHVAFMYHVPFVVIRAMSDVGDENAHVDFDTFIIEAGKKSAEMVLALIDELKKGDFNG